MPGWNRTEQHSRSPGQDRGVNGDDAPIESAPAWPPAVTPAPSPAAPAASTRRCRVRRRPPARRQNHAFDERLRTSGDRGRAKRIPHADLALAGSRTDEQQVGDVGAGNQQDDTDRGQQRDERGPERADQLLAKRDDTDRPSGIGLRETRARCPPQCARDRLAPRRPNARL